MYNLKAFFVSINPLNTLNDLKKEKKLKNESNKIIDNKSCSTNNRYIKYPLYICSPWTSCC